MQIGDLQTSLKAGFIETGGCVSLV